jgi:hypothetical protein
MSQTRMDTLIAPHGGALVLNMANDQEQAELRERANSLPRLLTLRCLLMELIAPSTGS